MKYKKVTRSFKTTALLVVIIPLLVLTVVVSVTSTFALRNNMISQAQDDLKDLAYTTVNQFEMIVPGEYVLTDDNVLMKGKTQLSGNYSLVDSIKQLTDVDTTIFYGDTRYVTSIEDTKTKERIIGTKAGAEVIEAVLKNGKDYFSDNVIVNNQPFYGFYTPIKNETDGKIVGILFTGRPSEDVNQAIMASAMNIIIISVVIFILALIIVIVWSNKVKNALQSVSESLATISSGKLNQPVDEKSLARKDEIGVIATAAESVRQSLYSMITEIAEHAGELNVSVNDLDNVASVSHDSTQAVNIAMDELATATMHNAENTQNANQHMNEMGNLIENIAADVEKLSVNADSMGQIEKTAGANLEEVITYINDTMDGVERIARQADVTNEAAQKIGSLVSLISSIAEETTLLSLNASIESARAGEFGKGFGVVASQIQKLADQSSESTSEIELSISQLLAESAKTVDVMAEVREVVAKQKAKIEETQGNFVILSKNVESSVESIKKIGSQASELNEHRSDMNSIITELSALSEENAASTQQTTATIAELDSTINQMATNSKVLNDISNTLKGRVDQFEV